MKEKGIIEQAKAAVSKDDCNRVFERLKTFENVSPKTIRKVKKILTSKMRNE